MNGFRKWRKVKNKKNCSLLKHMELGPYSPHNNAVNNCVILLNQSSYIDKTIEKQSEEKIDNNRLGLRTSIHVARWLSFQGITFRSHDESIDSGN